MRQFNRILFALTCILTVVALMKAVKIPSAEQKLYIDEVTVLTGEWEKAAGGGYEYRFLLPEDEGLGWILSIENYGYGVNIFLEDELIYAYEDIYYEKGVNQQWIELPKGSGGKELIFRSESSPELLRQSLNGASYIGRRSSVFHRFLTDNLYAIIFGCFCLFVVFGILLVNLIAKRQIPDHNSREMYYLAAFISCAGVWIVTDSRILQLFTDKTSVNMLVSFLSFMAMPYFLVMYMGQITLCDGRVWRILGLLYTLLMACCEIGYLFRLVPLFRILWIEHFLIIATGLLILWATRREIRLYHNEEMRLVRAGLSGLFVCGLCALAVFYMNMSGSYPYLYGAGIILFTGCLMVSAFRRLYYHLERSASMAMYQKLAYVDMLTQLKNRNAFTQEQEQTAVTGSRAYIVLDVNNLKQVNDQYGHPEGDRLLIDTARCLREVFGEQGYSYRMGGDEFVVILPEHEEADVLLLLKALDEKIRQVNQERKVEINIAYGYSVLQEGSVTHEEALKLADDRMYARKREMKGGRSF